MSNRCDVLTSQLTKSFTNDKMTYHLQEDSFGVQIKIKSNR